MVNICSCVTGDYSALRLPDEKVIQDAAAQVQEYNKSPLHAFLFVALSLGMYEFYPTTNLLVINTTFRSSLDHIAPAQRATK